MRPSFALSLFSTAIMLSVAPADARQITTKGITFSDERGGFMLESATGSGTLADPFVVVERVTDIKQVILGIYGLQNETENRIGTQHATGIAIQKIVINATGHSWHSYQVEVRNDPDHPSPYEDGLSFGQFAAIGQSYLTSSFPFWEKKDEPTDLIAYSGGDIPPGGRAMFRFVVTDMVPQPGIYIVQRPIDPVAQAFPHHFAERKNDQFR
ncbi:MAG TPA: hypothetical protein VHL08_06080 [Dongiaceae bacterium]|jgi:hypothetical protein|nr:hypothetical protein [Dongiaceae bacterium]